MILGFLRLSLLVLVGLTAIYLLVLTYSRSLRREALEDEFDEGGGAGAREDYIQTGMTDYEHSLRRKLILMIYIVPSVLFVVLFWARNFS